MASFATSVLETASLPGEIANDEQVEFAGLVKRNSLLVFRVAHGVLRNCQDAEDVAQETFLKLYRSGAWKRIEDEKAFLARTAWREAIDRLPKREQESLTVQHEEISSQTASPESDAFECSERALLRKLIDTLPEDLRRPLVLSALEELNSPQIAQIMGIPEGTVRTRLQRARAELKRHFDSMNRGTR